MEDNVTWAESTEGQPMGDGNPNLVTLPMQTDADVGDAVLEMEPLGAELEQTVATIKVEPATPTDTAAETNGKRPPRPKKEKVTCEVCNIIMDPSHFEAHMNGAKHARVVKKLANADGTNTDGAAATNPHRAAAGPKSRETVETALNACTKPVIDGPSMDSAMGPGPSWIHSPCVEWGDMIAIQWEARQIFHWVCCPLYDQILFRGDGPYIKALQGLNLISEVKDGSSNSPLFNCSMCNSVLDTGAVVMHVLGRKHCMNYMRKHYPDYRRDIAKNAESRAEQQELIAKYAAMIEEKDGRGEMGIEEDPAVIAEIKRGSRKGKAGADAEPAVTGPKVNTQPLGTKRSIVGDVATAMPKKGRVMQGVPGAQQAYAGMQEAPLTLLDGMRRCIRLLDTDSICTELESDIGTQLNNQLSVALMNYQMRINAGAKVKMDHGANIQLQRLQQQPAVAAALAMASETKPSGNRGRGKSRWRNRRGRGAKANQQPQQAMDTGAYMDSQMYDQQQQGYSSFSNYDPNNQLFQ